MLEAFLPIILLLTAGAVYRQSTGVENAAAVRKAIGSIVFTIFLPALAFHVLSTAPLDMTLITIPVVAIVTTLATLTLGWLLIPRLTRLKSPSIGSLILAAAWGNATYLGLPLVTNVYGVHLQRIPLQFDLLALTPLLFIVGTFFCVWYGDYAGEHSLLRGFRMVLQTPALLAVLAGLLINAAGITVPTALAQPIQLAGSIVPPLMVFSVGLSLQMPKLTVWRPLAPVIALKLVVSPLIGFCLATLLLPAGEVLHATVLETAMPSMVLPMVFAERYNLDQELMAQAILWTTVVAMITLPVVVRVLGG